MNAAVERSGAFCPTDYPAGGVNSTKAQISANKTLGGK